MVTCRGLLDELAPAGGSHRAGHSDAVCVQCVKSDHFDSLNFIKLGHYKTGTECVEQ